MSMWLCCNLERETLLKVVGTLAAGAMLTIADDDQFQFGLRRYPDRPVSSEATLRGLSDATRDGKVVLRTYTALGPAS